MGGGRTRMVWVVFVLAISTLDVTNCQDYSWDGAAAAGVPRTFYRFGPDIDDVMDTVDDGNTEVFELSNAFPFFGTDQNYLSISTNGGLVFGENTIDDDFDAGYDFGGRGYPMVAPFWNDINTEANGIIYYRISQDPIDLNRISATVKRSSLSIGDFTATYCVVATWSEVTHYEGSQTSPVNTFQAVLATDGEKSFVVFNYGDIGWSKFSTSAYIPDYTTVGFYSGTGSTIFLPLSGTAEVITIGGKCQPFGVGTYLYQVDGDPHVTASCADQDCEELGCSFCCVCKDGFSGNGEVLCSDADECDADNDECDPNAFCNNTIGSFSCQCKPGYTGNGKNCADADECDADNDECDPNAFCNNTIGSFSCQCKPGYTGNGKNCADSNECNDARTCDEAAECENIEGSFTCRCKLGYEGDGQICTKLDLCSNQPCGPNSVCINDEDKFRCLCTDGYEGYTCQAPPLALLDTTFIGFHSRIRLSTPSYEDTLAEDFEQVHDVIESRFGQLVGSSKTLKVWKAADGSSIVDIEVVLLDSEGITKDDVMGVITSAFPFTGQEGSRYTIDPKRVEVMFSRASSRDTGTTETSTYYFVVIGVLAAAVVIAIVISILLYMCIGSGQRAVAPVPQYSQQPPFRPPFRMPVMRRPMVHVPAGRIF